MNCEDTDALTTTVRGSALLGLLKQVSEQHGAEEQRAVAGLTGVREVFAKPIEADEFYPYCAFVGLLQAVADRFAEGDLNACRRLGYVASKHDLNASFKGLVRLRSPGRLIEAFPEIWSWYYRDAGALTVVSSSQSKTLIRVVDFPRMHPAHRALMEGWFAGALEVLGAVVNEDVVTTAVGGEQEFRFGWAPGNDESRGPGFATVRI